MHRGQFYTVFTLGFAAAIAVFGIALAITLLWWPQPAHWTAWAFGAPGKPLTWLSPAVFSTAVAGAAVLAAYWLVRIQQAIVHWSGNRLIAKLNREYNEVAQRLGKDQANEFMRQKAIEMLDGKDAKRFDLFGREEMLHALSVAGAQVRPPA